MKWSTEVLPRPGHSHTPAPRMDLQEGSERKRWHGGVGHGEEGQGTTRTLRCLGRQGLGSGMGIWSKAHGGNGGVVLRGLALAGRWGSPQFGGALVTDPLMPN